MNNNINDKKTPMIGDIYLMKFEGIESEQSGWRPGIVFQNNVGNSWSPNIIALPLTTCLKKRYMPTHVVIKAEDSGLPKDSMVLCENPEKMSKARIGKYITSLSGEYMKKVANANLLATAAISFLDIEELVEAHKASIKLNCIA